MTLRLQPAKESDLQAIAALMNAAYRGAESERAWSTEAGYITGKRADESLLRQEMEQGARFLLARDEVTAGLQGCVSLQGVSPRVWYLGSLAVDPAMQNSGFGRKLLDAAEQHAALHGARTIQMTVVSVRDTLIAWYERRGYQRTGETRPFPYGDHRFGTAMRSDLEFVVLEKTLLRVQC